MSATIVLAVGHYPEWDLAPMQEAFDLRSTAEIDGISTMSAAELAGVKAVAFRGSVAFGPSQMDALPNLEIIANFGVGYDAIDVDAATARGIRVTNTPDVLNDDVADLAVAMMIAQSRHMIPGSDWVRSGQWSKHGAMPLAHKVSGARAGIVGLGRIGRDIALRLEAFRMEIHYHSRAPKEVPDAWTYHADPVSLAGAVDFLFVALVGGAETAGYVSAEVIEALGPDGVIVNISRGTTIDEPAMLDALESGKLRGAALDVFVGEPKVDPRFLKLDNVVMMPHIGSATVETRKAMGQLQRDNLQAYFAGSPLLTPVN